MILYYSLLQAICPFSFYQVQYSTFIGKAYNFTNLTTDIYQIIDPKNMISIWLHMATNCHVFRLYVR